MLKIAKTDEKGNYVKDEKGNFILEDKKVVFQTIKTDEKGNPVLDEKGNPVLEFKQVKLKDDGSIEMINSEETKETGLSAPTKNEEQTKVAEEQTKVAEEQKKKLDELVSQVTELKKQFNIENPIPKNEKSPEEQEEKIISSGGYDPITNKIV